MKTKFSFITCLVLLLTIQINYGQSPSPNIPQPKSDLIPEGKIAIANVLNIPIKIAHSRTQKQGSWQVLTLNPNQKEVLDGPIQFISLKANGNTESYTIRQSKEIIYLIYWDKDQYKLLLGKKSLQ